MDYNKQIAKTEFCSVHLDEEKMAAFIYAVKNLYWYQMYVDDLPIWGIVGDMDESDPNSYYIYTHKRCQSLISRLSLCALIMCFN